MRERGNSLSTLKHIGIPGGSEGFYLTVRIRHLDFRQTAGASSERDTCAMREVDESKAFRWVTIG